MREKERFQGKRERRGIATRSIWDREYLQAG
jgi:hypothetical protein